MLPFKRQSRKMVKHTQTIRRQFADELFECVRPFYEIGASRVILNTIKPIRNINALPSFIII